MKRRRAFLFGTEARAVAVAAAIAASSTLAATLASASALAPAPARPSVVFILADDLGWGELGSYGQQKIRTPALDRLAAEGMRFTQHYAGNAVCATRGIRRSATTASCSPRASGRCRGRS